MTDTLHTRTNTLTGRLEVVARVGEATVSEYCGNLVSQCEQKRIAVARGAATMLAELRSQINRLDHWLQRDAAELARETAASQAAGDAQYMPPFYAKALVWIAMAISVLEVFVNKYGMDGLRMTESASWAMALLAALCLFLLSKLTGRVLRQRPWRQGEWGGVAAAALFNAAMVFTAIHIADARAFMAEQEAAAEGLAVMEGMAGGFIAFVLLGYGVMLFAAYINTPPCADAEQRKARIAALRQAVDQRWAERGTLAKSYNTALTKAHHDLAALLHDLAERSFQHRDGVKRGGMMPAYFRHALPLDAVKPIYLGEMIDPQPTSIAKLVGQESDGKDDPAADTDTASAAAPQA
jgi:hypothetical protein